MYGILQNILLFNERGTTSHVRLRILFCVVGGGWRSGLGAGEWLFDIYACAAAHSVLGYKKRSRAVSNRTVCILVPVVLVVLLLFASCRLVPKVKQKPDMRVF